MCLASLAEVNIEYILLLLLLGSPSEIQEFSLSQSSFPPVGGCLVIKTFLSLYTHSFICLSYVFLYTHSFVFFLFYLFVCCYKTRKSLPRLPLWARSKFLGSLSTRAAYLFLRSRSLVQDNCKAFTKRERKVYYKTTTNRGER